MITTEDIKKFQELYRIETDESISYQEAFYSLEKLVEMVRLIYKPAKKEDLQKWQFSQDSDKL